MNSEAESTLQMLQDGPLQDLSPQLRLALFLGGLALLSSAFMAMTAFTRIVIVLSFVRRALSTQEIPPNQVLLGLSIFMTLFVMAPTWREIESQAVRPYMNEDISAAEALAIGAAAERKFMLQHTREEDLMLFLNLAEHDLLESRESTPLHILIPAFIISELRTAFLMGFCLFLPFIVIDLVVSMILMALGMMMMPPVVVSTPCKILLFVLIDGWHLLAKAICLSFQT
ncbi:MAG: flagellar type III secretion system pore protein FliP [Planctomycetaceae bacterium]